MPIHPPTIAEALRYAQTRLAAASPTPQLDAAVLLSYVVARSRALLLAHSDRSLSAAQWQAFMDLVARRVNLEPIAYLVGEREFYGLPFFVDARVLVPRPETELLVERALAWITSQPAERPLVVVDLGTGSGCIAIALAYHAPRCRVYGLDLSPAALAVAERNVARHQLGERVTLLHSDGFAALPEAVDLVVSNPPYTLLDEIDEGVRRHEPHLALDGGPDGLAAYRELLPAAAKIVCQTQPGAVLLEIGAWQGEDVAALARSIFAAASVAVLPDLAGHDRVVEVLIGGRGA
ncbi:MAG: peptide chain release factor N(5)-glutamine methyltransferase [Herpetosiphonaceae bacterium]|nr:peptide chain release factor N(5)-glutamine methyltransferase [Herpetosiphonaceae bacterium]